MDFGCCLVFVFVRFGRLKALELKYVSSKICWDGVWHQISPNRFKQTLILNHLEIFFNASTGFSCAYNFGVHLMCHEGTFCQMEPLIH